MTATEGRAGGDSGGPGIRVRWSRLFGQFEGFDEVYPGCDGCGLDAWLDARRAARRGRMAGICLRSSSERRIAWRRADSLSLRSFLDLDVTEASPDHSTLSRTRRLIMAAEQVELVVPDGLEVEEVVADNGYRSDATLVASQLAKLACALFASKVEPGAQESPQGISSTRQTGRAQYQSEHHGGTTTGASRFSTPVCSSQRKKELNRFKWVWLFFVDRFFPCS